MTAAHVLLVDPDDSSNELVSGLLARIGLVTRRVATGEEALSVATEERPQCVLLEVRLPGMSGYEVCHELRDSLGDDLPIIFLSGDRTEAFDRVGGLLLGADDYLVKPFHPDELIARTRGLLRRARAHDWTATEPVSTSLTSRELQVLRLLADGLEQRAIAETLGISPKTVATYIHRVITKLGVHSRAQAVSEAYRLGLVSPPERPRAST